MTERPVYQRSGCCMPGCRRWSTRFEHEWLCGEHWRLVPRTLKAYRTKRLKQLDARLRKASTLRRQAASSIAGDPGERAVSRARNAWRRTEALIWRRMKRAAIERAAGL